MFDRVKSERNMMEKIYAFFQVLFIGYCILFVVRCCRDNASRNLTGNTDGDNNNNGDADGSAGNNNSNNNTDPDPDAEAKKQKRRERVREHLEFRTISESTKDISEDDLEAGDTSSSSSDEEEATKNISKNTKTQEIPTTVRSRIFKIVNGWSSSINTNNLDATQDTVLDASIRSGIDSDDDDEKEDQDPPSSSSISIAVLLQLMGNGSGASGSNNDPSQPLPQHDCCCSICLEPYRVGDKVGRLKKAPPKHHYHHRDKNDSSEVTSCNHWFHEDCILAWLQNHDECPLCRVNMVPS